MQALGFWLEALVTMAPLREAPLSSRNGYGIVAASQSEALKQVLLERLREMTLHLRLMDIKRFAASVTPDDDVTIRREFYKVTQSGVDPSQKVQINVKGDDRRLAIPIPQQDIQNSQGAIVQNPF